MVAVASTPSIITRPPVGSSSPAMMLKIVLLPQPDGPIRLTKRPCGIESVTGASAWKTPVGVLNVMLTCSTPSFGAEDDKSMLPPAVPQHEFSPPGTISQELCQRPSPVRGKNTGGPRFRPRPGDGKLSGMHKVEAAHRSANICL